MNVRAVATRIMKQFFRDKRSMALLVIAPTLVLTLIWLVLDGSPQKPHDTQGIPDPNTVSLALTTALAPM